MQADVLLFDVNETLLDVKALRSNFTELFGDDALLPEWFGMLLRFSLEVTVTGDYRSFDDLAVGAVMTTAAKAGKAIQTSDAIALVDSMMELPPHPDVVAGLTTLRDAGMRLVTLTNSRLEVVKAQLAFAGIDPFFETVLSVETVKRFKPHPATYAYASAELDVPIDRCLLVAAHDWDVNGALLAGAQAAFIERPGATRASHDQIPALVAPDLVTLAPRLIEGPTH